MTKKITVQIEDYILECLYSPGRPAQLYGPPENCYPEEPAEIEILSGKTAGIDPLTPDQMDALQENDSFYQRLTEEVEEVLGDEYDAHQEYLGEARRELRDEQ